MTASRPQLTILIAIACSALSAAAVVWYTHTQFKKIGMANAVRLFNGYHLKTDLEQKESFRLKYLGHVIDSIGQQIKIVGKAPVAAELNNAFGKAKMALDQEYQQSNALINEEVWKRLNPLIEEYGKKTGYHLIIGANGMGSVLYNDSYYEITDDLIQFINKAYEGERQ